MTTTKRRPGQPRLVPGQVTITVTIRLGPARKAKAEAIGQGKLAVEIRAAIDAVGWNPIETAPDDGTEILGYKNGQIRESHRVPREDCEMLVFGGLSGSVEFFDVRPTHWKPLPENPKDS